MKVKIKKIYSDSILPTKSHSDDAGFDLYAHSKSYDDDGNVVYGSGVAMEIPQGYVGLVFPRSSNAKKGLILSNSVGVVDSGFVGEITFKFKGAVAISMELPGMDGTKNMIGDLSYDVGDRIGQIIIMPYPEIEFVEVDELGESERGTGGYGSTGK